jgi:hypothetical protein
VSALGVDIEELFSVALDVCFRQNRPQERWRGRSDLTRSGSRLCVAA